ncbi:MAG TPA: ExeM/NucH family extracellular endonuclease, partial [Blastocatellia bacterium]|nr:ExeM/NucH family extracellular endonuclease [Blastocatellia bacterium]
GDTTAESNELFFVNVTNVTNAIVTDGQGQGTINNDDLSKIHDVQGNGAATPIPGATVAVEGVVVANFQGASKLQGFFLQEEDADADADPATSEGIFVFCNTCPTPVAEGQRVRATGVVSEFNNMTEITASAGGSVVITDAGNHLAEVTPAVISLPVVGDIDAFYESREGMLVTFADTLTVSEYFQLARFGQIELYQGGRPRQFTEDAPPSVAGYTAHLDELARRRVILDDDNNAQEAYLSQPDGLQAIFHPHANGGFSVGTQGVDFFRGGDLVNGLTGVLHWSFPGFGADTWRIRPTAAHPVTFTVANPRPATPPAVGGTIKAVSMNLLNYFTTIDTTSSTSTGPCGPSGGQDCRGADSVAELNRQRERASIVICSLNADIYALMELENTTPSDTINDLLGAVNARCGGAHPYAFVNTGGTLGTDAIRVQLIYRTGIVSPVGSPLVDLDPIHNRPPTAQTFDVVDATNPAFGQRFTVVANHFKSKGCDGSATGSNADAGDGQGCYNGRRTAQASRLLTWINGTVLPAAGNTDILLLGDFNSYAKEDPVTTLAAGGYTDLETALLGMNAYSYLFSGELGHLDYAFASPSLASKVSGVGAWHINADEVDLFDYNDEVKDVGESTFEEKPDGSALVPPRVVFQPGTPYRASDHDPVMVGLFPCDALPNPLVTPGGPTTFCDPGSVTLTSSAATSYQWKLNGSPIGGATAQQYVATASGSYTVTVTVSG